MRSFFLGEDQAVVVGDEIVVQVLEIDGDNVVLGVECPPWLEIEGGAEDELLGQSGNLPDAAF
jgi:hypothetical protein